MTRVRPAAAAGMATAALLALPLGAFARHPHQHRSASWRGSQQVKGTQVRGQDTWPPSLSSLTAGTVTSFANNVLTVTLNDGQVLVGTVDPRTKIVCGTPPPVPPRPEPGPGGPPKPPGGTTGPTGPQGYPGSVGPRSGSPRSVEPGSNPPPIGATGATGPRGYPGMGGPNPNIHPCGPDALTPGTLIHSVGLYAEPNGVHYMGLALIKPAAK